jgi:hypothetical protein
VGELDVGERAVATVGQVAAGVLGVLREAGQRQRGQRLYRQVAVEGGIAGPRPQLPGDVVAGPAADGPQLTVG